MLPLIPSWVPNLHPLIIHFPIVLVIAAAVIDLVDVVFERPSWAGPAATALYVSGAIAAATAYFTGTHAGSTVLIPGMAHPVLNAHRSWALATTICCAMVAVLRLVMRRASIGRAPRALLLAIGIIAVVLLQQTAERGARLVFEFGTGVIAGQK